MTSPVFGEGLSNVGSGSRVAWRTKRQEATHTCRLCRFVGVGIITSRYRALPWRLRRARLARGTANTTRT